MSYGMRIWGGDGALQVDENSFTMRVVHSSIVTGTNSVAAVQTIYVPGITPFNGAAFVVPIGSYSASAKQLETEVLYDSVRVYSHIRGREQYSGTTNVTMRLIVIRFF